MLVIIARKLRTPKIRIACELSNSILILEAQLKQIECNFLGRKHPKSEALFLKTSWQIERLTEIVFTVFVKILLQCLMLPKCIVSFAAYFITESGNDSFQLPVPFW